MVKFYRFIDFTRDDKLFIIANLYIELVQTIINIYFRIANYKLIVIK